MDKTCALITVLDMVQGIVTLRDYVKLVAEPEVKPEIPVYMVGLPEDPFEAEVAKSKFLNAVGKLKRGFPEIEEARSVIKISESFKGKERRRYEVDAVIKTPSPSVSAINTKTSTTAWPTTTMKPPTKPRLEVSVTVIAKIGPGGRVAESPARKAVKMNGRTAVSNSRNHCNDANEV